MAGGGWEMMAKGGPPDAGAANPVPFGGAPAPDTCVDKKIEACQEDRMS